MRPTKFNLDRAKKEGKIPFKATRKGCTKWTLGSSLEQCKTKLSKWQIEEITWDDYLKILKY